MSLVIPSVFSTDAKEYVTRFHATSELGKRIHVDVMDGKFVRGKSPPLIFLLNKKNELDIHLMVSEPEKYVKEMKRLKAKRVFIHFEINNFLENLIKMKEKGFLVGIAIKPKTKVEQVIPYIGFADLFLVMGVEPGKEGQKFILNTEKKANELKKQVGNKEVLIDGGINLQTITELRKTEVGAVVGSFVSKSENPGKELKNLRKILK